MKIECPYCRKQIDIQPEHLGQRVYCPFCKCPMEIPALPARFIDPPQQETVSQRMITRGVFWALLDFIALLVIIALIFGFFSLIIYRLVH